MPSQASAKEGCRSLGGTAVKYPDGPEVSLGYRVKLGDEADGLVACTIDTGEYSDEYPRTAWEYLKSGVVIASPKYGLDHDDLPDKDLQLIGRAASPSV
jgi:hypothetical protein